MNKFPQDSQNLQPKSFLDVDQFLSGQFFVESSSRIGLENGHIDTALRQVQSDQVNLTIGQQNQTYGRNGTKESTESASEFYDFSSQSSIKNKTVRKKKGTNVKQSRNKLYAKNYRRKRKQQFKALMQENNYLKSKVNELTFRLQQVELELCRIKNNKQPQSSSNFQTVRQSLLSQISTLIPNTQSEMEKLIQLEKQLQQLDTFENKHKMDMLNYHMSQVMENLISNKSLYFVDSFIEEKGLWNLNNQGPQRQMDYEVCQIMNIDNFEQVKASINSLPYSIMDHFKNFKNLWKKLYEDYINIINQGNFVDSLCRPLIQRRNLQKYRYQVLNCLKLQLYFQRIKYRKDMRQLRQSWFRQFKAEKPQKRVLECETI